jgi:hypothetical protein
MFFYVISRPYNYLTENRILMKSNKSLVVFSIVLALASLFQLSFTFQAKSFEKEARQFRQQGLLQLPWDGVLHVLRM